MKGILRYTLSVLAFTSWFTAQSQQDQMKQQVFNFSTFPPPPQPVITQELISMSPGSAQHHPEFGILPYNTQCEDCIELIDKRTADSRYFIKNNSGGHSFFVQQGYAPLHYLDVNGRYISIDPHLHPDPSVPGQFIADHQPIPTSFHAPSGSSTLHLTDFPLTLNAAPRVWLVQGSTENPLFGAANNANTSVGSDGALTRNLWNGIDRTVVFERAFIETNYHVKGMPALSSTTGWLAFEDAINLPPGFVIRIDSLSGGTYTQEGYWTGDLVLTKVSSGQELARWARPTAADSLEQVPTYPIIAYQLKNSNGTFFVRTMVSIPWLLNPSTQYPVTIDPPVSASATWSAGKIGFTNYAPGDGFCGNSSAWCLGGPLNVTFPANATVTNVVWGLTYHGNAGHATGNAGFRMVGPCGEDPILPANQDNWYSCGSVLSGNCTGTGISSPWLATCTAPSCSPVVIPFNLKNIDCSGSSTACSVLSYYTTNNTWNVTVSGSTLEALGNTTTGSGTQTVTGSCWVTSTLDPTAANGVPAYTYSWSPGGQTTSTITVMSGTNCSPCGTYTCTVKDACGNVVTAVFTFNVSDCVLPVNILSFDANYNGSAVDLTWESATETNNSYYTLERSTDATNFRLLANIPSKAPDGNSSTPISYSYADPNTFAGLYYYRLKQTDRNGITKDVKTIPVPIYNTVEAFSVAPNPTKDLVDIRYQSPDANPSILRLINGGGMTILNKELPAVKGMNETSIDLKDIPNGLYFLTLITDSHTYKAKLVKE